MALNLGSFYENETYHYTSSLVLNPSNNSVSLELVSDASIFGLKFESFGTYFKLSFPLKTISIGMQYILVKITDSVNKLHAEELLMLSVSGKFMEEPIIEANVTSVIVEEDLRKNVT